ncbi:cell wall-binding repeat-containing protein [Pseudoclavibacter helvolus]|uniref:cell wall-binding repeat-containing protein n=1 Tax=Pseudoclavibacter helvolus TaxID=255205 RepID=UPI000838BA9E|nr:cell wall-binding repeat-containing protein [Pseudoclavibacter helvolus]
MRAFLIKAIGSLALASLAVVDLSPVASAAPDVSPPTLHSFDFTPKTIDVSTSAASIKVTARISDPSGAEAPTITVRHDSGQSAGFGRMTLVSGNATDGSYERTVTIPKGSAPGTWDVALYPLDDLLGNAGKSFGPPAGYPSKLTVTNGPTDVSPPTLHSFDFTPKTIDVSTSAASIKVTARISDPSGAEAPTITVRHDSGQSAGFGRMTLVSGNATDGSYERTVTIPKGSAPGTWDVALYPLDDLLGNSEKSFGPPAGYPSTLTVTNGPVPTPTVTPGTTTRLAGDDRYQTSVAISKSTFKPGVNTVYIANGTNFPDALSGAPWAAAMFSDSSSPVNWVGKSPGGAIDVS